MAKSIRPTDGHPRRFKRGQAVEYTYAGGKVVPGRIVRYSDMSAVPGRPDLRGLTGWWIVRLVDEVGPHGGACHENQIRLIEDPQGWIAEQADQLAVPAFATPRWRALYSKEKF